MIKYIKGDLFSHQAQKAGVASILAHACNCRGSWGAGVAVAFKKNYPSTYEEHYKHCKKHTKNPSELLGSTQLIASSKSDPGNQNGVKNVYVACLFTSDFFGTKKLGPTDIVSHTDAAMKDLTLQISKLSEEGVPFERNEEGKVVLSMPKINAGLFGVPWDDTERILQQYKDLQINVYVID